MAELFPQSSVILPSLATFIVAGIIVPISNELSRRRDRMNEAHKTLYAEKLKGATGVCNAASALLHASQDLFMKQGTLEDLLCLDPNTPRSRNFIKEQYFQKDDEFFRIILRLVVAENDEVTAVFQSDKRLTEAEVASITEPLINAKTVASALGLLSLPNQMVNSHAMMQGMNVSAAFAEPFIRWKHNAERSEWELKQGTLRNAFFSFLNALTAFISASVFMETTLRANQWLLGPAVWNDGSLFVQVCHQLALPGTEDELTKRNEQEARIEGARICLDALSYGIGVSIYQDELTRLIPTPRLPRVKS